VQERILPCEYHYTEPKVSVAYTILQLGRVARDNQERFKELPDLQNTVDVSKYDIIYQGSIMTETSYNAVEKTLSYCWIKFNTEHEYPEGYLGLKINVGDIVIIDNPLPPTGNKEYYHCQFWGWRRVYPINEPRVRGEQELALLRALKVLYSQHEFYSRENRTSSLPFIRDKIAMAWQKIKDIENKTSKYIPSTSKSEIVD
jgi:hypothetical protein